MLFALIGGLAVGRLVLSLLRVLLHAYVLPGISLKRFGAGKGAWALVTGCTDGIGREFVLQLASKQFNVVLVSRTMDKLTALAKEIEAASNVETRVVQLDFTNAHHEGYDAIDALAKELEINVLVNNVGVNSEIPIPFVEESEQVLLNTVQVNTLGAVKVTRSLVPGMIQRKNGLIINVGSAAGWIPTPLLSVYSGTKAFLSHWSQAIGVELAQHNVIVENLNAFFVVSNMSKIKRASFLTPSAKDYVRSVLGKIGLAGGASMPFTSSPYPSHALINWAIDTFASYRLALKVNYDMHVDIRKRALKKRERQAKKE